MKNNVKSYIILFLLFLFINVISFSVPIEKNNTFWVSYVFTVISFAAQAFVLHISVGKRKTLKSKFLGFPILYVGFVYLLIQTLTLFAFLFIPNLPLWSAIAVSFTILIIFAFLMIAGDIAQDEIERIDKNVREKRLFIKNLQIEITLLIEEEQDQEIKKNLEELAEKVRFSDPMSDERLMDIEKQIADKVGILRNEKNKSIVIQEINLLLTKRNKVCKALK